MRRVIYTVSLGLSDYFQALRMQHLVHARCRMTGENVLLITEHQPVITLGYRRRREQLRLSPAELAETGVPLAEVERGGGATYHGPGQLIAYPIFSSLLRQCRVREFIFRLEEVMCGISQSCGVAAARQPGLPGVWVREQKLGAVGIAVRGGVSLHGFALNVNVDLQPFSYIVPCGLTGKGVTNLEQEAGRSLQMTEALKQARLSFAEVFTAVVVETEIERGVVGHGAFLHRR
jgi:lipoate-protein ligase B